MRLHKSHGRPIACMYLIINIRTRTRTHGGLLDAPVAIQYTQNDLNGSDARAYTRRFQLSTTVVRRTAW